MVKLVKYIFTKKDGQIKNIDVLIERFQAAIRDTDPEPSGAVVGAVTGPPNLPVNGDEGEGGSTQGGGRKKRISKKKGRYSKKKKVRYSKKKKINSKRKRRS